MISILCSGSRGDIQPYIALAQQIARAGKAVRIVAGRSFETFVRSYGIDFYPLSLDYQTAEVDPQLIKDAQSSDHPLKMLLTFHKMKKYAALMTDEMYKACEGNELIVYHPGCTIGYFAAEEFGIPSVLASPFPLHKTREVESLIAYGRFRLPGTLSHTLLQNMLWTASKPGIYSVWKKKQGGLPKGFGCPFERVDEKHPAIICCSDYVFPRPKDWDTHIHQHGYWFVEERTDYVPPAILSDFLAAGEPPIYIGFGSVFHDEERDFFLQVFATALQQAGLRGIFCGISETKLLDRNMLSITHAPHTWLFPRCAAVCHHGGAGTTAAGFRAGVPSIIVPFSNDQFAWAYRAYHIGVGTKPIHKKQLSSQLLADAFQHALQPGIRLKAQKLARDISVEAGAADCAQVILGRLEVSHSHPWENVSSARTSSS